MAFRTRRQHRYLVLRDAGFLPFEARALSKVPTRICPYMRHLIADRKAMFLDAKQTHATNKQYENRIKALYNTNKWLSAGKLRIQADPWKMLRDYEDRWRAKQPEYTSPWQKRWRDWKDFQAKTERTIRKQKGRA